MTHSDPIRAASPASKHLYLHGFLLCAALLPLGCNKPEAAPTPEVYVQAVHPEQGTISEQIVADATLAPLAQAAISPKITAPVHKFFVQRGSHVKAGQLLATLENRDLQAAALDNQGSYKAAQGAFETATRAQVPEDTTKAQTDLLQAKTNLDLNQSIVRARTQLFNEGALPGRDLDTAKAALVQAQAAYDIAKQHLDSVQQVSRKAALQSAQGQLTSAQGKYLGAEAQLSYSEIRSPINGVVTDRPLFAGETAATGTPLITVMDTSALLAKLHLAQTQAQQLAMGATATVTIPGVPDAVPAKVSFISPALDPGSTTVEIWLRVENPKGIFKAGTPVRVSITGRTAPNALIMPAEAVQTATDGVSKSVMVIAADSTAHKKPVTVGIQTAESVQILSGLTTADMVITTGGYGLDDNTKVKIGTDPNAKPDADDKSTADAKPEAGKDAAGK
ncbi:MAG TPA: efflux RND transporter periplasmic adaptor subunit [Acidisarcina sp.]|nr:efflux RND transporter periplasmic adaptor subunit [Acidisarcina sp.]